MWGRNKREERKGITDQQGANHLRPTKNGDGKERGVLTRRWACFLGLSGGERYCSMGGGGWGELYLFTVNGLRKGQRKGEGCHDKKGIDRK